jgi:hypothetical protein
LCKGAKLDRKSLAFAVFTQSELFSHSYYFRNPASGYVQGINDILMAVLVVLLQEAQSGEEELDDAAWSDVEGDSYWMLSKGRGFFWKITGWQV